MKSRGQQSASHQPPEFQDEPEVEAEDQIPTATPEPEAANPWLPIADAPKDRILEGRFAEDEEVGRPIRWRPSRRRVGQIWVNGGVWYAAETVGAVQLHPTEWRGWRQVDIHFEERGEAPVAA